MKQQTNRGYHLLELLYPLKMEWLICGMAEWRNGEMEEWRNGVMAEWRNGGMVEWWNGGMGEWQNGEWNGKLWYGGQIILYTHNITN